MKRTLILLRNFLSREAKKAIYIPPHIQEVLTGLLLGDGSVKKPSITGQSTLSIQQKELEFVQFLWDIFNTIGIVGAAPHTRDRYDKHTEKTYTIHTFNTFTLPVFAILFNQWYTFVDGKSIKHLPSNISDLLTPVAIAFWLCGDGHYMKDSGVVRISTDSFTISEVQQLQSILLERYNIKSTLSSAGAGKEQYRIRIAKASMPTLQSLVSEHMPPMMRYRVGL